MPTITTAFAVPLVFDELQNPEALNAELRELFLQCESNGDKYANPDPFTHRNKSLFESNFSLFDWPQAPVGKLREFCISRLYHAVQDLNGYDIATLQKLHVAYESWFHITRGGGYFGVHNHPMHSWSGVYCVCQEGDDPDGDSGKLTFISPFASNTMFIDMAMHRLQPPFNIGNLSLRLRPGQLILFPSWVLHEVTAFEPKDSGLRITVAFNARFRMQGIGKHTVYDGR